MNHQKVIITVLILAAIGFAIFIAAIERQRPLSPDGLSREIQRERQHANDEELVSIGKVGLKDTVQCQRFDDPDSRSYEIRCKITRAPETEAKP